MKVLTAAQMREVDRRTIERGIPGIILMENAGMRVVEFLRETFAPLEHHRVAIFCGKGNNGGDGFVIARQLYQRKLCGELTVIEVLPRDLLTGDAAQARTALAASGCPVVSEIPDSVFDATIVVDAVLGTGIKGAVSGRAAEVIEVMNSRFPHAAKVAVDIPSGLPSDQIKPEGNYFRTNYTVTFTALKSSQALSPSYEFMGKLVVHPIGSPDDLCATNRDYTLHITTPADLGHLFKPRERDSNKGMYGHVLVVGGSVGKSGAPAMSGLAVLRIGAGLVTIASAAGALSSISAFAPELMTEALPETKAGHVASSAMEAIDGLLKNKTLLALGPGLGTEAETVSLVREIYQIHRPPLRD